MRVENKVFSNSSFEPPETAWYLGRLIGISFIGLQKGGEYGNKEKLMLRWELSYLDGSGLVKEVSEDKKKDGRIKVVTQSFNLSLSGQTNRFRECLLCHDIIVNQGEDTDTHDWLGHTCRLFAETKGNFSNATAFEMMDETDVIGPHTLPFEHWEPEDKKSPPMWADAIIAASLDPTVANRASPEARMRRARKQQELRSKLSGGVESSGSNFEDMNGEDIPF